MASGSWRTVKLADLIAVKHGWPFKSEFFSVELTGRPIVVSIGNFEYTGGFRFATSAVKEYRADYPREYELSPGDTVLIMTCQTEGGEILGIPARVPNDGRLYLHNQRMGKVVVKRPDLVEPDFLYCVFLWGEFNRELMATASGTKIVHTAPSRIEGFEFDLPPLDEQRSIASVLGPLDDKIELNRQMNRTLDALVAAIFKSWFVDFDPVVAKAEGRAPFGVDAHAAALFPSSFENSELGPIPEGWRPSTVGEEFTVVMGQSPPGTTYNLNGQGSPFFQGRADFGSRFPSPRVFCTAPTRFAAAWDTLVSVRAPVGAVNMAKEECSIGRGLAAVRHKRGSRSFTYLSMANLEEEFLVFEGEGTLFGSMGGDAFRRISILAPDPRVVDLFEATAFPLDEQISLNEHEAQTLAALRDTLLPKLLSGEIRVGQAEKALVEV